MAKPATSEELNRGNTLIHSLPLMPTPPWTAMATPLSPAIGAWLSLVGMPNHQAAVAQSTMANSAAHRAMKPEWHRRQIDHIVDSHGHRGVDSGHDHNSQKLKIGH